MKRITTVVAAAVLVGAFAAACAQSSSADVSAKHLSVVGIDEKAKTFEQVDLGKSGFGAGDQLIEQAPVQDSTGKAIGTSYTIIGITSGTSPADAKGIISCSINLSGGIIYFAGGLSMAEVGTGVTLPVTGGTGSYAGAGGTVRMQAPNAKKTNMTFDLLIPKTSS